MNRILAKTALATMSHIALSGAAFTSLKLVHLPVLNLRIYAIIFAVQREHQENKWDPPSSLLQLQIQPRQIAMPPASETQPSGETNQQLGMEQHTPL
jgi:hypothetical protein